MVPRLQRAVDLLPTWPEAVAAALLAALSLAELLQSSRISAAGRPVHALVAIAACSAVAWTRAAPTAAALAWCASYAVDAVALVPAELLGAGLAGLGVAFGAGAYSQRSRWPAVAAAFVGVWLIRDLRDPLVDAGDMAVDLALTLLAAAVGTVVAARTSRARELETDVLALEASAGEAARSAVAEERARIARELHDIVAHSVSVMVVQAGTSRPRAERADPVVAEVLGRAFASP